MLFRSVCYTQRVAAAVVNGERLFMSYYNHGQQIKELINLSGSGSVNSLIFNENPDQQTLLAVACKKKLMVFDAWILQQQRSTKVAVSSLASSSDGLILAAKTKDSIMLYAWKTLKPYIASCSLSP